MRGYYYLFISLFFAIYCQIIFKLNVTKAGIMPSGGIQEKGFYLLKLLSNPWMLTAFLATFASGIFWIFAISILELSKAYPFLGINFVIMFYCGILLFNENFTWLKFSGTIIIMLGVVMISKS